VPFLQSPCPSNEDCPVRLSLDSRLSATLGFQDGVAVRAVNGLRLSAVAWSVHRNKALIRHGWKTLGNDRSIFYKQQTLLLIFVDNLTFCGPQEQVKRFHEQLVDDLRLLEEPPESRNNGDWLSYDCLGMDLIVEILRNPDGSFAGRQISFDHSRYVGKIVNKFSKGNHDDDDKDSKSQSHKYKHPYLEITAADYQAEKVEPTPDVLKQIQVVRGELSYLHNAREDIDHAMRRCCSINPKLQVRALRRIYRCLRDNPDLGHRYRPTSDIHTTKPPTHFIETESDSSWGNGPQGRSFGAYVIELSNNCVLANCHLQDFVSLSTTEAETYSGSEAARQALAIHAVTREMLQHFRDCGALRSYMIHSIDNKSAVLHASNPANLKRLKHLTMRSNFLKMGVEQGHFVMRHRAGKKMKSDALTKAHTVNWLEKMWMIGLVDLKNSE
jgi:hypothetical protein